MPTNAVYQPTTVTYEQQPNDQRWNCPISYFSRRVTSSLNRVVYLPIGLCLLGSTLSVIGLALLIVGGVQYSDTSTTQEVFNSAIHGLGTIRADNRTNGATPLDTNKTVEASHDGVGVLIAGGVILFVGLIFIGAGLWAWSARRGTGKEAPANGAAALTALNPSMDPLVAAQYAPVRDAPPAPDDEMRNLMDNKECLSSAEESDKMLDGRPSVA